MEDIGRELRIAADGLARIWSTLFDVGQDGEIVLKIKSGAVVALELRNNKEYDADEFMATGRVPVMSYSYKPEG